jgi:Ran GTPase-activating protein (RanGAP) involved in mRNA processing and transport
LLKELSLSHNQIGDKGAQALARAFQNSNLTKLYLNDNQIGDKGARAFAKALRKNTVLKEFYLSTNPIGDVGARSFTRALRKNFYLEYFDFDNPKQMIAFCQRNQKANMERVQFQIFFQQKIKK